jgi:hypothetical protein
LLCMLDVGARYAMGVAPAADDIAFPCAAARERSAFGARAMRVLMSSIAAISACTGANWRSVRWYSAPDGQLQMSRSNATARTPLSGRTRS